MVYIYRQLIDTVPFSLRCGFTLAFCLQTTPNFISQPWRKISSLWLSDKSGSGQGMRLTLLRRVSLANWGSVFLPVLHMYIGDK